MSPISPHRPTGSLDHAASNSSHHNHHHHHHSNLPNIKQDIHSDDLIETLHQFHQEQRDLTEDDLKFTDHEEGQLSIHNEDDELTDDNEEEEEEEINDENDENKVFSKLNSDDIVVPVSSNNQPNLQYPPSYQYTDNGATISFMNSKLQKTASRNSISSINANELYPLLQFDNNFITTIPESFSNSTISSFDSVPPTLTHSITNSFSNASLQMSPSQQQPPPPQQQQQQQTPLRLSRKHSISNGTTQTPLQLHTSNIPQYQTPLRKTPSITPHRKSHQRTRSRLSLDANGSAVISINGSSATTLKSPGGVNPFYTPPSFLSPRTNNIGDSPHQLLQTPFATPLHPVGTRDEEKLGVSPYLLLKKDEHKQHKRFKSNDFHDFTKAADLSLQLADKLMNNSKDSSSSSNDIPLLIDSENSEMLTQDVLEFNQKSHHHQIPHYPLHFNDSTISRSRSSINLSTTLVTSTPPRNNSEPHPLLFMSMHSHNPSIPQNIYQQFDKLNFIPEIQQQPYAPLIQFPLQQQQQDATSPAEVAKNQDHHGISTDNNVEIIVENKKEKKQKVHQCPLCGGRFQRPEHVKRHMRSHSSEKPFMCGICNKRFNRNDNMKAHERKIHGIDKGKKNSS